MENNSRYLEACGAGERSGLYYTCVNSYLTAGELAYILTNSESQGADHLAGQARRRARGAEGMPERRRCASSPTARAKASASSASRRPRAACPTTPIADECLGTAMLYSSGTTGRPKGILRPLPENPPAQPLPLFDFLQKLWQYRDGMIYLSPAPLYHSAPQAAVGLTIRTGGTVDHHGAFRSRAVSRADREIQGHAQPAGADDVLADAEAAGGGAQALRPVLAGDRDPRRRALPGRRSRRR